MKRYRDLENANLSKKESVYIKTKFLHLALNIILEYINVLLKHLDIPGIYTPNISYFLSGLFM